MAQMDAEQQAQLQAEVQRELERREWAEPDDSVMAEYITVLLANGSTQERVQTEMDDLVGSDFDPRFLDWLFDKAEDITRPRRRSPSPEPAPAPSRSPVTSSHPTSSGASGGSRLLSTALGTLTQPEKRKLGGGEDHGNKRRIPDNAPSGPRMGAEGRSLADRLGGRNSNIGPGRGGLPIRGMAGGRGPANHMPNGQMGNMNMGNMGNNQQGFNNPQMMQPGFGGFFPPGQQEMMAQMMMMQANMAQMSQMMSKMSEEKQAAAAAPPIRPVRPARPPPFAKLPQGTKLGSHSVSSITPTTGSLGPIPAKPSSTILCRFSVGCSNARCTYSHPSPVADEQTGMVLSEEPCEEGKDCKDKECIKSHVSPAAVLGESAGPSRLLCKYQNCTNPSCAFRHEDAEGNPIPPPALTAAKAAKEAKAKKAEEIAAGAGEVSDGDDGDVEVVLSSKSLMDGPLDDSKREVTCRYGERCTRPDCRFSHPKSRPPTKGTKYGFSKTTVGAIGNGMNRSKKFGVAASAEEKKLNPAAGEFKPATPAEVTTE